MPKVFPIGPYALYFWSRENNEPPHIHVRREDFEAKFWLNEWVELADNHGFRAHELNRIQKIVLANRELLLEAWNDHFKNRKGNS